MNERLLKYRQKITEYWTNKSKKKKGFLIGGLVALIVAIAAIYIFTTRVSYVPLYSNLSAQETGQIKSELDSRGVPSEISQDGQTISVPSDQVDTLKVELAAQGIPKSGTIDYSFFSQNASFGMTDNEFNVLKVASMQTEIANLIKGISGVNDAKVMITLPQESVFANDKGSEASASVVLNTKPGYEFDDKQIKALYHLVSKSVPNLPTDNIVITNQYFEYFDLKKDEDSSSYGTFMAQNEIKKQIERDLQRQVQTMLGTMMGNDKVIVSVSTDLDFTKENRDEQLVEPVDKTKMQGLAVSAERITETYTGKGAKNGGTAGTGQSDVSNYTSTTTSDDGDYEKTEERLNYDVNRIHKKIVESPYKVKDIGIQVMVEPPKPNNPSSLSQQSIQDIQQILGTIIRTSIQQDPGTPALTNAQVDSKIALSVQKFNGKQATAASTNATIPLWMYIVGGSLVVIILLLLFLLFRRRKNRETEYIENEEEIVEEFSPTLDRVLSTEQQRRKKLEQLAKDNPEEFAKLLRTWLAED
ncbi:flagellar basal-body MS-ring/collar protein FliF [Priestia koreensis]|uniref:flagellar basal-body MS-ring/collar protein FliF n=1 Tax=Priestia koreensis TaxID=284581 RepID=UPI003D04108E